jgi:hypothetical protein
MPRKVATMSQDVALITFVAVCTVQRNSCPRKHFGHMSGIKSKLSYTCLALSRYLMSKSRLRSCYFCHQCDEMYSYVGVCSLARWVRRRVWSLESSEFGVEDLSE